MNTAIMNDVLQQSFSHPDEVRTFEKGKIELLHFGDSVIGRATLQPGWRWSLHVKPIAGTEWCEAPHFQYHVSGRIHIRMADGKEFEAGPGDVTFLPAGHDAWVVGKEPVVMVDWQGLAAYATAQHPSSAVADRIRALSQGPE